MMRTYGFPNRVTNNSPPAAAPSSSVASRRNDLNVTVFMSDNMSDNRFFGKGLGLYALVLTSRPPGRLPRLCIMALHGIEQFFVALANSVIRVWTTRRRIQLTYYPTAKEKQRALFWANVNCALVTLLSTSLAAGVIYLFWWAFTTHERLSP